MRRGIISAPLLSLSLQVFPWELLYSDVCRPESAFENRDEHILYAFSLSSSAIHFIQASDTILKTS